MAYLNQSHVSNFSEGSRSLSNIKKSDLNSVYDQMNQGIELVTKVRKAIFSERIRLLEESCIKQVISGDNNKFQ